ncbi:unnamed protein product, partial [Owenia fusiformis]
MSIYYSALDIPNIDEENTKPRVKMETFPEGRNLHFDDGVRRIDFVLAYDTKDEDQEKQQTRTVFERNLQHEGLELEKNIQDDSTICYIKIHVPWETLTRYAEIMKLRVPMEEKLDDVLPTFNLWELMAGVFQRVINWFALDKSLMPPFNKQFTCVYNRHKEYLFAIPSNKETFFLNTQRSMVVDYILRRKRFSDDPNDNMAFGIRKLISDGFYEAAYPLHEGSWKPKSLKPNVRKMLYDHWAHWSNWHKLQPLDYIRYYFGAKIGMYFAWLGFYTYMLIPASIVGLVVFIYGLVTFQDNVPSDDICNKEWNITMCPQCDNRCPFWNLNEACTHSRVSRLFDNGATVFFSIFMTFWGTFFLEFWKRQQASIQYQWNLIHFEDEEEPPRPEYLARMAQNKNIRCKSNPITKLQEPHLPFWKTRVPIFVFSFSIMLFLLILALAAVFGVVAYRMAIVAALYLSDNPMFYRNASIITSAT